ncbi:hypothetical protein ACIFOC_00492 [Leucobacter aridicollis]|uniref:RNA polymerase sigma factor n=1 Tax=Leucobacter aridicollis TaxID=283878 RepID=UPI0037CBECB4
METVASSELEELARRANEGDREAGARFIADCIPYWTVRTRGIVHRRHQSDVEDLVQNAVIKLIELWNEGKGPVINPRSYVVVSIRNAYTDRLRSPRSRAISLDGLEETGSEPVDERNVFSDELMFEQDAVRRAFAALNEKHRVVLHEVLVNGAKPAELAPKLRRSAPAISNLLNRAKLELRRQLLIEYLSGGGIPCAENALRVPKRVKNDPELHGEDESGIDHVLDCPECTWNWRRFAAVGSMLGVLPLLTLATFRDGTAFIGSSASAAFAAPVSDRGTPASPETRKRRGSTGPIVMLIAGVLVAVTGAVMMVVNLTMPEEVDQKVLYTGIVRGDNPYGAVFDVTTRTLVSSSLSTTRIINADFDVAVADSWQLEELRLRLSGDAEWESFPADLDCAVSGSTAVCTFTGAGLPDTPFTFRAKTAAYGFFSLDIRANAGGERFEATAGGEWK